MYGFIAIELEVCQASLDQHGGCVARKHGRGGIGGHVLAASRMPHPRAGGADGVGVTYPSHGNRGFSSLVSRLEDVIGVNCG